MQVGRRGWWSGRSGRFGRFGRFGRGAGAPAARTGDAAGDASGDPAREPLDAGSGAAARVRHVTLVTRAGCHLCVDAEQTLRRLRDELGFAYEELDVDADPQRRAEYSDRVPVILIDGREHGYWRVEEARFRAALQR